MMIILYITIGILISEIITLMTIWISRNNEDAVVYAGTGIIGLIAIAVLSLIQKIIKVRKCHIYKALIMDMMDEREQIYYASSDWDKSDDPKYKNCKWADNEDFKDRVGEWNKEYVFCGTPNLRYAPKSVWSEYKEYTGKHRED